MATPARRIAAEVLMRVAQGGAFANLALDASLRQAGQLPPREVALATELAYGTLRWQLQLDRALLAHSDRALEELDEPVRVALRLGAFELLHHEKVPARAAVNEAVELTRELKVARASGFVNAVLRRLSETRTPPAPPGREVDFAGHVAAVTSHPRWMVELWTRWLGAEEAERLCAANQEQAPACVRVARRKADLQRAQRALAEAGVDSVRGRYSPDALILAAGAPPALDIEGHHQGLFQAQDEAAQLVSMFAAPAADARILDACAAPGGKACHLAELAPRGSVLAVDLHARKARIIAEAAQRLGIENLRALAADALFPIPGAELASFDLVLLDAPCSGLGTLRRHPEMKMRRTPEDVDRLAQLQARLLESVRAYVKPGGLLVYALCTLTPGECDEQVERFVAAHRGFVVDPPPAGFPADCLAGRFMRTLPHRTGTDGFFAARLRRVS
ncbi:MAG TPA: 16S rRNA (cytosine(967)-C(5))-methyltransferase RsmB [Myxococcales bacterium]